MKKIGIIVFVAALTVGVVVASLTQFGKVTGKLINFSFGRGVKGSGVTAVEKRDVAGFSGIDVSGIFEVELTAQKDFSIEIEADDNLLPLIRTEVHGGVLKIESEKRFKSHGRIRIRISAPDIDSIEASGVSKVTASDLKSSKLNIDTSGASMIILAGETSDLSVDVSGASSIDADKLAVRNAQVDASGASTVNINAQNRLIADVSGASTVRYGGNPTEIVRNTSGAAKVVPR